MRLSSVIGTVMLQVLFVFASPALGGDLVTHSFIAKNSLSAVDYFPQQSAYQVCFTPGEHCTAAIVHLLAAAKKTIDMQAYAFTSRPIAKALVAAQRRGVLVQILVDASDLNRQAHSVVPYLLHHHVPIWQDNQVNIAHNKVLIVDAATVETGSFNYTYSAQHFNAENVLIIHCPALAAHYLQQWQRRKQVALKVQHMLPAASAHGLWHPFKYHEHH